MMFPFDLFSTEIEQIFSLPWAIGQIFLDLLMVCFYPVVATINMFIGWLNITFGEAAALLNSIINIGNYIMESLNVLLNGFPSPWVALLLAVLALRIGYRIYFYVKDIEILGNKI